MECEEPGEPSSDCSAFATTEGPSMGSEEHRGALVVRKWVVSISKGIARFQ
jgi:hypothetical protein